MSNKERRRVDKIRSTGLYAKGSVYALIGILTAMTAIGLHGKAEGKKGVTDYLMEQPLGLFLVAAAALGLLCYSIWRIYESIIDPDGEVGENRIPIRLYYLFSGLVYGFFAYNFAKPLFSLLQSSSDSEDGGSAKKAAIAEILSKDWGPWVIGAIGVIVAFMAGWQIFSGVRGRYMKKIDDIPDGEKRYKTVKTIGKVGYIARGIVFGILSFFLFKVVWAHSADEYKGTEGAFNWLLSLSYGVWLMAAVALGLLAYGIFTILVARYSTMTKLS